MKLGTDFTIWGDVEITTTTTATATTTAILRFGSGCDGGGGGDFNISPNSKIPPKLVIVISHTFPKLINFFQVNYFRNRSFAQIIS